MRLRWRWWEFVPELATAAALTYFLVDETDAATSAASSTRAIALCAGVALTWSVGRLAAGRWVPWALLRAGVFLLAGAVVVDAVVLPAYDDDTVTEAFPAVAEASTEPAPVRLLHGPLRGIDHRATGTVALYRRPNGSVLVGLEDFDIQPGPDYDVYLVPGADRDTRDGGVRLDDLRGNQGTQYYDVPPDVPLASGPWTLLVWCQTFGVPVANATLS